jgi:ureidoacrylate peracid hydrolase
MNLNERIDPRISALLVIDVQNDFCHPDGVCGKKGYDVHSAISMVPRLKKLVEKARLLDIPVIFIKTEHNENTESRAWLDRYGVRNSSLELNCRTGSWGEEFCEVLPKSNELVITKHRYSAFIGTNLNLILRSMGRSSLLFTGVATNTCVESSLRDALSHDYYVTLVEDCCAAFADEDHTGTIRNVQKQFGLVTTGKEILTEWKEYNTLKVSK